MRAQLEQACQDAALARAEASSLRTELAAEREARTRAEAALHKHRLNAGGAVAASAMVPSGRDLGAALAAAAESSRARPASNPAAAAPRLAEHAALKAQTPERRPEQETGELVAALDAAASSLRAAKELAPPADGPSLRAAVVALARQDSLTAGSVLAALLPVQGAIIADDVTYDLTVRGIGTFGVTIRNGHAQVQRLPRRRSRREAEFHVAGEPLALAQLLAGERSKLRRFGRGARVSGRRKRAKALAALPGADLSLAEALHAGARLEPSLIFRTLPFVIDPEWTRGHVFTVAQEITELAPRAWYVMARDGVPLHVVEHTAGGAADATVTMTRAAFERLLRGEPAAEGDLPIVRGDHAAVASLKRWTDRALRRRG